MRPTRNLLTIVCLATMCMLSSNRANAGPATINYGDVALSGGFQANHFEDEWDLTQCDLILSLTYDGTGLVDDSGAHAWGELGIREIGYGDFNPTWMAEGAGVWLATDYDWTANTFDPDPPGSPSLDLDDKLILQKGGGLGEGSYNLPSIPPNPGANHRVWWDRDGVDPWQNDETANTGGFYNVVITLHATSSGAGTAYMSINGLYQGFETDGDWNTIELTPSGMTFTGDMKHMQVFYGIYGYGATHTVEFSNITAQGCLFYTVVDVDIKPETLNLNSKGVFTAFVNLQGYDEDDIIISLVECEGAPALEGAMSDDGTFVVKFDREDLVGVEPGDSVELTVVGDFVNGGGFKGSDTIRIIDIGGEN